MDIGPISQKIIQSNKYSFNSYPASKVTNVISKNKTNRLETLDSCPYILPSTTESAELSYYI